MKVIQRKLHSTYYKMCAFFLWIGAIYRKVEFQLNYELCSVWPGARLAFSNFNKIDLKCYHLFKMVVFSFGFNAQWAFIGIHCIYWILLHIFKKKTIRMLHSQWVLHKLKCENWYSHKISISIECFCFGREREKQCKCSAVLLYLYAKWMLNNGNRHMVTQDCSNAFPNANRESEKYITNLMQWLFPI